MKFVEKAGKGRDNRYIETNNFQFSDGKWTFLCENGTWNKSFFRRDAWSQGGFAQEVQREIDENTCKKKWLKIIEKWRIKTTIFLTIEKEGSVLQWEKNRNFEFKKF